jgi:hypothetical protein
VVGGVRFVDGSGTMLQSRKVAGSIIDERHRIFQLT